MDIRQTIFPRTVGGSISAIPLAALGRGFEFLLDGPTPELELLDKSPNLTLHSLEFLAMLSWLPLNLVLTLIYIDKLLSNSLAKGQEYSLKSSHNTTVDRIIGWS